jgi:hypothetical protein
MASRAGEKASTEAGLAQGEAPGQGANPEGWGWNRRQRMGLGIFLTLLVAFLVVQFLRRPVPMEAVVRHGPAPLPEQVDPNVASVADLARIPHVGDALAAKIVSYRDARKGTTADGIVFRQASDLDAVPGIGATLVEQLGPFLKFPGQGEGGGELPK